MSKVAFIVPLRNKAQWVERCARSILEQTIDDIDVLISDQGSDDGSYEVVSDLFFQYTGNKSVKLLRCPHTDLKGMAGLNAHYNFIHEHVRSDFVITCSADDYNHPQRAEKTLEVFEKYSPSYVGTRVRYTGNGQDGEGTFPDRCTRWIAPAECIVNLIGSTASGAWARDLFEKYKPLRDIESQDIILPYLALMERGLYYIDEVLHYYEWNPSLENTGLMGRKMAARTDAEKMQLEELECFHSLSNWIALMRRYTENGHHERLSQEARQALYDKIMGHAAAWCGQRLALTMNRIDPQGFGI